MGSWGPKPPEKLGFEQAAREGAIPVLVPEVLLTNYRKLPEVSDLISLREPMSCAGIDLRCMCDGKHADRGALSSQANSSQTNQKHTKHRDPINKNCRAGLSPQRMGWRIFTKNLTPPPAWCC